MRTSKTNGSHTAAVRGGPQTLSTTLDDIREGGLSDKDHSTGRDRARPGFTDREDSKRRAACRVHAFGYARRIVLSAMAGEVNGDGLFFDVVGLQQHLAEGVHLAAVHMPTDTRSVRLLSDEGPLDAVVSRFCAQVQSLCSPGDIPNPPATEGLQKWAAATQRNIRSQFAGWALEIVRQELDALADKLANPES